MKVEDVARICHEANKSLCETQGDFTQNSWDEAPVWQRKSAIKGIRFHLDNPDATPESSHESWLKEKEDDGWSFGAVKNPDTKEHPCFVPYSQLPEEQKAKDYLFRGIIHSLAPFIETEFSTEINAVNSSVRAALPRYKSHKEVYALKIKDVQVNEHGAFILPEEKEYLPFQVDADYVAKHNPQAGGYYVVYRDGYKSWSPAEAFEDGYTKLD